MQPHQERVIVEKKELDEKLAKLKEFCFGSNTKVFASLSPEERDRLEDQYTAMKQYSDILGKRIAAF
jgi:crAss001_48 related protein